MNTFLAWFVTFNFINIGWVFFRAKEFDDAVKVLKGMFGLTGISLPNALSSKLAFLGEYGVEFGSFISKTGGNKYTVIWVAAGLVLVLAFKNSMELRDTFKLSRKTLLFSGILFGISILSMNKVSEFLYFNF